MVGENSRSDESLHTRSFESLTQPLITTLWRTAYRLTGSRDKADDLTQDACIKAFKSFDQYQMGTNYKAWIFRILTNLWRDAVRKEARAPFKIWDEDEVDQASARHRSEPEHECQNGEFYKQALEAIARLSPHVRLVVCFSLLDGLSYQEIADVANIPIGTVRSRLSRGRRQLQDDLSAHRSIVDKSDTTKRLVSEIQPQKKNGNNEENCPRPEMLI